MSTKQTQSYLHFFKDVLGHLTAFGVISILSLSVTAIALLLDSNIDKFSWGIIVIFGSIFCFGIFSVLIYFGTDGTKTKKGMPFYVLSFLLILFLNISMSAATIIFSKKSWERIEKAETVVSDVLGNCKDNFNEKSSSYRCSAVYIDPANQVLAIPRYGCSGYNCSSEITKMKYEIRKRGENESLTQYNIRIGIFGYVFNNNEVVNDFNLKNQQGKKWQYKPIEKANFTPDMSILCVPVNNSNKKTVGVVCVSSTESIKFTKQDIDRMNNFANQLSESLTTLSNSVNNYSLKNLNYVEIISILFLPTDDVLLNLKCFLQKKIYLSFQSF